MTEFEQAYIDLLIKQYWEKPNARAEIQAQAATWEKIRDTLAQFGDEFDLDLAVGEQLDIIGKIVGLPRSRPEFNDDTEYRFFLRVKIARNTASAFLVSDTRTSLQDVIQFAFDGLAYVIDNKNMSMTLYLDPAFSLTRFRLIVDLDLLPRPQGVQYVTVVAEVIDLPFGFSELGSPDPTNVGGFGELGVDSFELSDGTLLEFDDGTLAGLVTGEDGLPVEGGKLSELIEA